MSTIVLRLVKGTPLTNAELDANFSNLNTDKLEAGTTATLTNKTISLSNNTFTATSAQMATAVSDKTGTGALVFANSPTLVTPTLGTPASVTLTNATGLPISTGVSGLGTGIATALAVNVGTAGAPVINGGALGTPSSGTVTNLTGTASININGTVGATTANTGAFTTLTTSSTVTLNGGTANGVAYLNGSKVLTTGSALTFDGSRLGIGPGVSTASSLAVLHVFQAGGSLVRLDRTGAGTSTIQSVETGVAYRDLTLDAANSIFSISGSEQMRLTSTGLGIGTSSPGVKLQVAGSGRFTGFDTGYYNENVLAIGNASFNPKLGMSSVSGYRWNTRIRDVGGSGEYVVRYEEGSLDALVIDRSGNVGIGVTSPTSRLDVLASTDAIGANLRGRSSDDIAVLKFATAANVETAAIDIRPGAAMIFAFGSSRTERMRLDSSGNLLVGTTSNANNARLNVQGVSGTHPVNVRSGSSSGSAITMVAFYDGASEFCGQITIDAGANTTQYNTSSDYRLKNITGPIINSGAYIDSLNPVEGTWKADGSTFVGLIAHEVQEASRTTVATGTKDGEQMQGMDYSSAEIIANLIAEVKSLRQRLAAAGI